MMLGDEWRTQDARANCVQVPLPARTRTNARTHGSLADGALAPRLSEGGNGWRPDTSAPRRSLVRQSFRTHLVSSCPRVLVSS